MEKVILNKKIWVEVETNKGTPSVSCFRGLMDEGDFKGWVEGTLAKKCIKLESTYWYVGFDNTTGQHVYTVCGHYPVGFAKHTGQMYLITKHIVAIQTMEVGEWRRLVRSNKQPYVI